MGAYRASWLAAALGLPLSLLAQEPGANLQFSAFGTLGVSQTDSKEVGYRRDVSQPMGVFDKPKWNLDSRFGLQLSAKLGDHLLATAQAVSKYGYDGSNRPDFTWICLTWTPINNLQVRAGLTTLDSLPNLEISNVGYTYLWARPSAEVFGALGSGRLKGIDVSKFINLSPSAILEINVTAGVPIEKAPVDHVGVWDLGGGRVWGVGIKFVDDGLRGRLLYTKYKIAHNLPGSVVALQDGLVQLGTLLAEPKLAQVAGSLAVKDAETTWIQAGLAWERGRHQAQGTFYHASSTNSFMLPDIDSGYLSYGYRFGQWTPYAMFARTVSPRAKAADLGSLPGLVPFLPEPLATGSRYVIAAMDQVVRNQAADQHTLTAGLRWDFAPKADLKFQIDQVRSHNAIGKAFNPHPDQPLTWNGRMTVFTVTLDFIFGGGR